MIYMKKTALVLFLLITAKGIFAADFSLSAGGGGLFGYTFTRYTLEGTALDGNLRSIQTMDRINYGGFLFFDATYGVLSVIFQGGSSFYAEDLMIAGNSEMSGNGRGEEISLGISLMGKYPFSINGRVTWFPMLGVEYHFALRQWRQPEGEFTVDRTTGSLPEDLDKNGNPYPLSAWNSWWINIGAGFDFYIVGPLFLRSEFIFGFRLPTRYEMGALDLVRDQFTASNIRLAGLTGSPNFRIGLGYRF